MDKDRKQERRGPQQQNGGSGTPNTPRPVDPRNDTNGDRKHDKKPNGPDRHDTNPDTRSNDSFTSERVSAYESTFGAMAQRAVNDTLQAAYQQTVSQPYQQTDMAYGIKEMKHLAGALGVGQGSNWNLTADKNKLRHAIEDYTGFNKSKNWTSLAHNNANWLNIKDNVRGAIASIKEYKELRRYSYDSLKSADTFGAASIKGYYHNLDTREAGLVKAAMQDNFSDRMRHLTSTIKANFNHREDQLREVQQMIGSVSAGGKEKLAAIQQSLKTVSEKFDKASGGTNVSKWTNEEIQTVLKKRNIAGHALTEAQTAQLREILSLRKQEDKAKAGAADAFSYGVKGQSISKVLENYDKNVIAIDKALEKRGIHAKNMSKGYIERGLKSGTLGGHLLTRDETLLLREKLKLMKAKDAAENVRKGHQGGKMVKGWAKESFEQTDAVAGAKAVKTGVTTMKKAGKAGQAIVEGTVRSVSWAVAAPAQIRVSRGNKQLKKQQRLEKKNKRNLKLSSKKTDRFNARMGKAQLSGQKAKAARLQKNYDKYKAKTGKISKKVAEGRYKYREGGEWSIKQKKALKKIDKRNNRADKIGTVLHPFKTFKGFLREKFGNAKRAVKGGIKKGAKAAYKKVVPSTIRKPLNAIGRGMKKTFNVGGKVFGKIGALGKKVLDLPGHIKKTLIVSIVGSAVSLVLISILCLAASYLNPLTLIRNIVKGAVDSVANAWNNTWAGDADGIINQTEYALKKTYFRHQTYFADLIDVEKNWNTSAILHTDNCRVLLYGKTDYLKDIKYNTILPKNPYLCPAALYRIPDAWKGLSFTDRYVTEAMKRSFNGVSLETGSKGMLVGFDFKSYKAATTYSFPITVYDYYSPGYWEYPEPFEVEVVDGYDASGKPINPHLVTIEPEPIWHEEEWISHEDVITIDSYTDLKDKQKLGSYTAPGNYIYKNEELAKSYKNPKLDCNLDVKFYRPESVDTLGSTKVGMSMDDYYRTFLVMEAACAKNEDDNKTFYENYGTQILNEFHNWSTVEVEPEIRYTNTSVSISYHDPVKNETQVVYAMGTHAVPSINVEYLATDYRSMMSEKVEKTTFEELQSWHSTKYYKKNNPPYPEAYWNGWQNELTSRGYVEAVMGGLTQANLNERLYSITQTTESVEKPDKLQLLPQYDGLNWTLHDWDRPSQFSSDAVYNVYHK